MIYMKNISFYSTARLRNSLLNPSLAKEVAA